MLLAARKQPTLERLYAAYARRLLRRAFAHVHLGGSAWPETDGPIIAFVNHSAWWDPVLTLFLSRTVFARDGYGVMDAGPLTRYPFFRRIGCFGATTRGVEDVRALSAYAREILTRGHRRTLWLFPQGELLPARAALAFRSGAARFARAVPEAPLVPVAVRYEMRAEQRPECFIRIGDAVRLADAAPARRATRLLEHRLADELAALDESLARPRPAGFRTILNGASSISDRYDATLGRLGGAAGTAKRAIARLREGAPESR